MKKRGCKYTTYAFHLVKWKRGASHIEMILAFVLFVSVVGFGLYFLSPINPERLTDTTMDYVYREISKNVTVGVESFSVKITEDNSPLAEEIGINVSDINGRKWRVENTEGFEIGSSAGNGLISISNTLSGTYFILIKLSEDLPNSLDVETKEKGTSEIASSNYEKVFSEQRIQNLNTSYYANYSGLKKEFNIPDRTDFGFELVFTGSDFIKSERKIPNGLEVFSAVRRVEVLRSDGTIRFAELVIELW